MAIDYRVSAAHGAATCSLPGHGASAATANLALAAWRAGNLDDIRASPEAVLNSWRSTWYPFHCTALCPFFADELRVGAQVKVIEHARAPLAPAQMALPDGIRLAATVLRARVSRTTKPATRGLASAMAAV